MADQYPEFILPWVVLRPGDYSPEVEAYLLEQLKHPKVVALGEIGLGALDDGAKDVQERFFAIRSNCLGLDLPL